jgi:hypothetical protein
MISGRIYIQFIEYFFVHACLAKCNETGILLINTN